MLSTTDTSTGYAPTFVGYGYLAARVPSAGAGFSSTPITTQSELAGLYASSRPDAGATRAGLPTWTTLGFGDGTSVYGATQSEPCVFGELCPAPYGRLSGGAVPASDHSGSTSGQFAAGLATSTPAPDVGAEARIEGPLPHSADRRQPPGTPRPPAQSSPLIGRTRTLHTITVTADHVTWPRGQERPRPAVRGRPASRARTEQHLSDLSDRLSAQEAGRPSTHRAGHDVERIPHPGVPVDLGSGLILTGPLTTPHTTGGPGIRGLQRAKCLDVSVQVEHPSAPWRRMNDAGGQQIPGFGVGVIYRGQAECVDHGDCLSPGRFGVGEGRD